MIDFNIVELINHVGGDFHTYYDKELKCFIASDEDLESPRYIIAPFKEHSERAANKIFYNILTEEELEIANAYPYRHGFFRYLHETGLIERYREAEDIAATAMMNAWIEENNISVNL